MVEKNIGSNSKIKKGAIFSIIAIVFEILVNFFLIKYLTTQLGAEYGVYTLALSVIGIFLADFGLSQAAMQFVAKCRYKGDKESENKLLGIFLKIYLVLDLFILIIASILFFFLQNIYSGLTPEELSKFKVVYIIVTIYCVSSFPCMPLNGILGAYEEFSLIKILNICQKVLSSILLFVALIANLGLYAAVLANVCSALVVMIIKLVFVFKKCKIKPDIRANDKKILKSILSFTLWVAVSSLASRLSIGMLSTVLASTQDSSAVAIFGIAVTLETYAYTFSTILSGLFLPKITRLVEEGEFEKINNLSISVGKFQTFISGLFLMGFILFGQKFLGLYLEPMYEASYFPTICLFLTVVFTSSILIPQTASFSLNTVKYVSIIELAVSVVRLGLCWLFSYFYGITGMVICYLVLDLVINALKMFFVFYKKQKLNIKSFVCNVYGKACIIFIISTILGFILHKLIVVNSWLMLIIACLIFALLYCVLSFIFYFDKKEKKRIYTFISKKPIVSKIVNFLNKTRDTSSNVPVFFCVILILCSLFSSNYPLTQVSLFFLLIFFVLSFGLYLYFVFPFKTAKIKYKIRYLLKSVGLIYVLIFVFSALVTILATNSFGSIFGISRLSLYIISSFLFVEIFSFDSFFEIFKKSFFVVCLTSLFFTIIIVVFGKNFSPFISSGIYHNYFFIFYTINGVDLMWRNTSLFWEPGIFASYCLIALALVLFFDKSSSRKKIIYCSVFVFSLITTGSLAGYLLIGLMIPFAFSNSEKRYFRAISWLCVIVYIIVLIAFIPFYQFFLNLFPVLQEKGVSLTTRILSFMVDMDIFTTSPIFGVGDKYQSMFNSISEIKYPGMLDTSLNTFGFYIAYFGVLGFALPVLLFYSIFSLKEVNLNLKIAISLLAFLILSKEPHSQALLTFIFIFYIVKHANYFSFNKIRKDNLKYTLFMNSEVTNE